MPSLRAKTAKLALDNPGPLRQALVPILAGERNVDPWIDGFFNLWSPRNKGLEGDIFQLGWGTGVDPKGTMSFLTQRDVKIIEATLKWIKQWKMEPYDVRTLVNPFFRAPIDDLAMLIATGDDSHMRPGNWPERKLFKKVGLVGAGKSVARQFKMIFNGLQKVYKDSNARADSSGYKHPDVQKWWYSGT